MIGTLSNAAAVSYCNFAYKHFSDLSKHDPLIFWCPLHCDRFQVLSFWNAVV